MKKENSIKVVIDTNIWISFLIGKVLSGLSKVMIDSKITILFSDELFEELVQVLSRPKFKEYFSEDAMNELVSLLHLKSERIEIKEHFEDCRDPKDNFLLDLCVSGNADYLITGGDDLLALNPFHGVKIIHYQRFRKILQEIS